MSRTPGRSGWRRYLFDWRIWTGLVIPAIAVAYTMRGIALADVAADIGRARLLPILCMVPVQLLALWVRSYRWGCFTEALAEDPPGLRVLLRATAVGSLAINLLPFRIGELARPWALSKETNIRGSAALGTVVLERAIDFTTLSVLGGSLLFFHTKSLPAWVQTGALVFALLSLVPFGVLILLRWDRDRTLEGIARLISPLPARVRDSGMELTLEVCRGLEALRGFGPVLRVALLSVLIWAVILPLPFLLGLIAFDIDLPLSQMILATFTAHVFVALAVAAPSAPGFFGVYHFACREALAFFGVAAPVAVGFGTVVHMTYWLPVTLVGAVCAVQMGARIADLADPSLGKAASEGHR